VVGGTATVVVDSLVVAVAVEEDSEGTLVVVGAPVTEGVLDGSVDVMDDVVSEGTEVASQLQ
jgi:hypothetical protein